MEILVEQLVADGEGGVGVETALAGEKAGAQDLRRDFQVDEHPRSLVGLDELLVSVAGGAAPEAVVDYYWCFLVEMLFETRPDGAGGLLLEIGIFGGWIVDAVAAIGGPDFFVDGEALEAFGFEMLGGGSFAGAGDAA